MLDIVSDGRPRSSDRGGVLRSCSLNVAKADEREGAEGSMSRL